MRTLALLICCLSQAAAHSQLSPSNADIISRTEDTISALTDSLIESDDQLTRIRSAYAIIPRLKRALLKPGSFEYAFDSLRRISIEMSPDGRFRVFTWQLRHNNGFYKHYGVIQMKTADGSPKLYPLLDATFPQYHFNAEDTLLFPDYWYGALYYNIVHRSHNGKSYYYMFGYDANSISTSKKVVDVLHFVNGKPMFGAKVFHFQTDSGLVRKMRHIIEYSVEAAPTLNYNEELDMIIYDHLQPADKKSIGIYATYLPDGTYQGFQYKNGIWLYVDKVFNQMQSTPPFPKPVDFDNEFWGAR